MNRWIKYGPSSYISNSSRKTSKYFGGKWNKLVRYRSDVFPVIYITLYILGKIYSCRSWSKLKCRQFRCVKGKLTISKQTEYIIFVGGPKHATSVTILHEWIFIELKISREIINKYEIQSKHAKRGGSKFLLLFSLWEPAQIRPSIF